MATAALQPYIAKLGFSDPDRSKDRHGLACEYLFERLLELEVAPYIQGDEDQKRKSRLAQASKDLDQAQKELRDHQERISLLPVDEADQYSFLCSDRYKERVNKAKDSLLAAESSLNESLGNYGIQKARSLIKLSSCMNVPIQSGYMTAGFADVFIGDLSAFKLLGEVKITKQSAETVLQQINYYRQHIRDRVDKVYILTDYDCSDLQRLTQGSDISVYRLGKRFEDWIASRSMPSTPEL